MEYREGITSPKLEPNVNAKGQQVQAKANYCAHMYCSSCPFARSCKEKPDQLPPLGAIGLEPVDQFSMSRGGSGRHRTTSMRMGPSGPRAGSIGLGIGNFAKPSGSFSMGNFATPDGTGKPSEGRFVASNRAVPVGCDGAPAPFGRPNDEVEESGTAADSMSEADAKKRLDQDSKEFFASTPPSSPRPRTINSFEEGFMPIAELLDDIAIDAPNALDLMAVMVKGASLSEDTRGRITAKSVDGEKLLALLST
ncbi:hypothetical protein FIBSPDRAFT_1055788 [Athelia psychrophila]|uniref:Uncharacterized protein n=1 Tax=Athelia psychrophila TaxID=1759441 RepID=A0A167T4W8_9AGAM|nr:hypothetical protein FIBSPDRAFT_1055788 [Fibularhizoctonia sp. CBS 109695]